MYLRLKFNWQSYFYLLNPVILPLSFSKLHCIFTDIFTGESVLISLQMTIIFLLPISTFQKQYILPGPWELENLLFFPSSLRFLLQWKKALRDLSTAVSLSLAVANYLLQTLKWRLALPGFLLYPQSLGVQFGGP